MLRNYIRMRLWMEDHPFLSAAIGFTVSFLIGFWLIANFSPPMNRVTYPEVGTTPKG